MCEIAEIEKIALESVANNSGDDLSHYHRHSARLCSISIARPPSTSTKELWTLGLDVISHYGGVDLPELVFVHGAFPRLLLFRIFLFSCLLQPRLLLGKEELKTPDWKPRDWKTRERIGYGKAITPNQPTHLNSRRYIEEG